MDQSDDERIVAARVAEVMGAEKPRPLRRRLDSDDVSEGAMTQDAFQGLTREWLDARAKELRAVARRARNAYTRGTRAAQWCEAYAARIDQAAALLEAPLSLHKREDEP